jgi:hypothetical protein
VADPIRNGVERQRVKQPRERGQQKQDAKVNDYKDNQAPSGAKVSGSVNEEFVWVHRLMMVVLKVRDAF